MVAVFGTYENGEVKLDQEYSTNNPVKVIVTFLEDVKDVSDKPLSLSDFSFAESQKNLQNFEGSLSEALVEERRMEL